jgi:hypothetical protein
MFGSPIVVLFRAAALVVTLFALWKGDRAVRLGAVTHFGLEVATFIVHPMPGDSGAESILLALDFVTAVVFLLLAVRYASLWLGAAMLLQSAQFSLHAYYLVMEKPHDAMHAWINNTTDLGVLVAILIGTILAIRRRAADAREEAEREALRQKRSTAS